MFSLQCKHAFNYRSYRSVNGAQAYGDMIAELISKIEGKCFVHMRSQLLHGIIPNTILFFLG